MILQDQMFWCEQLQPLLLLNSCVKILYPILTFKSCVFKVYFKKKTVVFFVFVFLIVYNKGALHFSRENNLYTPLFLIWKNKYITGNVFMSIIMQNTSEWMHILSISMTIKGRGEGCAVINLSFIYRNLSKPMCQARCLDAVNLSFQ